MACGQLGTANIAEALRALELRGGNSQFPDFSGLSASPNSALSPSFGSPPFFTPVDGVSSSGSSLGQNSLGQTENLLQQLALLSAQQQQQAYSPHYNNGGLSAEQLLAQLGCMSNGSEANDLLVLQAQLAQLPSRRAGSAKTRTGPMNNPLYKTELCRSWEEFGSCRYGVRCQFAHGHEDLNTIQRHPKYKTEVCRTFATNGTCPYGTRCRFIHQSSTLAQLRTATNATTPRGSASAPDLFAGSPQHGSMPQTPMSANSQELRNAAAALFFSGNSASAGNLAALAYELSNNNGNGNGNGYQNSNNNGVGVSAAMNFSGMNAPFNYPSSSMPLSLPLAQTLAPIATPHGGMPSGYNGLASAPVTPRDATSLGDGGSSGDDAGVKRISSDNSLVPSGTPTSARRLPIFSQLADCEGTDNN